VLSKGKLKTFNPIKRPNLNKIIYKTCTCRTVNGDLVKVEYKLNKESTCYNVWYYPVGYMKSTKDKIAYEHPAIFPDQLVKDHILSWSNEGDWVLDPFLGSGTTLKVCMETNRNGVGFEISEKYENIIKERLKLNHRKLDAYEN
jgi:site-specific DNA-methyltransferase (adenine-specific)